MNFSLMRYKLVFMLLTCCYWSSAQTAKPLKIGDAIPNFKLDMLNYKSAKANLSDFKGKLLILDFWFPECAPCTAQFPKLEKLQKDFSEMLVILPVVTFGERNHIENFYSSRKKMNNEVKLPTAINASALVKRFPSAGGYPHEVWIDPNGKIIAITDELPVNASVINKILNGAVADLPDHSNGTYSYSLGKPLLVGKNGGPDSAFLFRSMITHLMPGVGTDTHFAKNGNTRQITRLRSYPVSMYVDFLYHAGQIEEVLMSGGVTPKRHRIIDESNSNQPVYRPKFKAEEYWDKYHWEQKNLYNYELIVPDGFQEREAYSLAAEDISRYFNILCQPEKRLKKCLVLYTDDKTSVQISKGKKEVISRMGDTSIRYVNYSISEIASQLDYGLFDLPVIAGVSVPDYGVDIALLGKYRNISHLKEELAKQGIIVREEEVLIDVLVLKDRFNRAN